MADNVTSLVDSLAAGRSLSADEYERLVTARTPQLADELAGRAREACERVYGDAVFTRALIEISNVCRNDCYYCGIRRSNRDCARYQMDAEQVMACAREGWRAGFRTFVLQGGESSILTDAWLGDLVRDLKASFPGCAVTLSVGERSRDSYRHLREAGADRYLLRHETATPAHYQQLHPAAMSFDTRMECLRNLRELGYAVGTGFMVGSPFQTPARIAADLKFIEHFKPEMCGIGPFVPHHGTPFTNEGAGTVDLTCYLLSLIRLMRPAMLLPATTALEALEPDGRERAIRAGANVVMPNVSPAMLQESYELYDRKPVSKKTAFQKWAELERKLAPLGRRLVVDRGDVAESSPKEDRRG